MKRAITCIVCPRGCTMTAEIEGEKVTVTGNSCPRGEKHAIEECTNPVRTLTSTVRVSNREDTMVSVKSAAPIPKEKMAEIMEKIRAASVEAPVSIGDVILTDIYGTDIVATKEIN
ncbi:MAG: DUF1667 domain-containing protein [Eubacteriales bacterium]